jgi:hypothetical protein
MNTQVKQRLFITFVALAMLGLLVIGIKTLASESDARSVALAECMKDNFQLFELCYRKTNQEISPSFFNYISPFLPATLLLWVSWLFKLSFQLEVDDRQSKSIRKVVFYVGCFVATLGCFFPLYIVLEKTLDRLASVLIYQLFLMPWLAVSWLCAPLLFQRLLDPENRMIEFIKLKKVALVVLVAPLVATVLMTLRQAFSI